MNGQQLIPALRGAAFAMVLVAVLEMPPVLPVSAQDAATPGATPAPAQLTALASQTLDLNGKDKIWQINRVTALTEDQDAAEFEVGDGFILAHEIPLTVTVGKKGDPQTLEVGQAIAVGNREKVTVFTPWDLLGSFYTLELIEQLDINNSGNRLAIGQPFPTTGGDYTLTLSGGNMAAGETGMVSAGDIPGLLLVLDGSLSYVRPDGTATTLDAGIAASQDGAYPLTTGANGATYVIVTLTLGNAGTPAAA